VQNGIMVIVMESQLMLHLQKLSIGRKNGKSRSKFNP